MVFSNGANTNDVIITLIHLAVIVLTVYGGAKLKKRKGDDYDA